MDLSKMNFLFFVLVLLSFEGFSQLKYLEVSNQEIKSTKIISENKRIQIETNSGLRLFGKFKIIDTNHISIKNKIINLEDIVKLKRKTLGGQILKWVFLGGGSFAAVATIGVTLSGDIDYAAGPFALSIICISGYYVLHKIYPYQNDKWILKNIIEHEN